MRRVYCDCFLNRLFEIPVFFVQSSRLNKFLGLAGSSLKG